MAPPSFKPLTITPVSFSLTEGTNIPAPPASPPPTPSQNTNGGPLTSHPTTPNAGSKMPGTFPPSPSADAVSDNSNNKIPTSPQNGHLLSPATSPVHERKRPSSAVRRLLSIRSMRGEKDRHQQIDMANGSSNGFDVSSRPGSPYTTMSDSTNGSLQKRRSSAWFGAGSKRKSGFFTGKIDEGSVMHEGGAVQPVVRKGPPPPMLPEFHQFGSLDGALDGGDLGAEDMFKDIK